MQSLVINSSARRTCTVGEIVNLVSADTQKLMDFVVYFNAVWLAPIEIALCLFFLWQVCLDGACPSPARLPLGLRLRLFLFSFSTSAHRPWQGLPPSS